MTRIQVKRGDPDNLSFIPAAGEPILTTDAAADYRGGRLNFGDGSVQGGIQTAWWATPHPGWRTAYYYYGAMMLTALGSGVIAPNFAVYTPIYIGGLESSTAGATMQSMSVNVTGLQAATNCRIGIYSAVKGQPKDRLIQSGDLSCASTGLKTYSVSRQFIPGWYFLAFNTDATTATFSLVDNVGVPTLLGRVGSSMTFATAFVEIASYAGTPLPATATILAETGLDVPCIQVRAA